MSRLHVSTMYISIDSPDERYRDKEGSVKLTDTQLWYMRQGFRAVNFRNNLQFCENVLLLFGCYLYTIWSGFPFSYSYTPTYALTVQHPNYLCIQTIIKDEDIR